MAALQAKLCHVCLMAHGQCFVLFCTRVLMTDLLTVLGCVWWVLADRCSSSLRRAVGLVRQEWQWWWWWWW